MDVGGAFHVEPFDVWTREDEESYCRIEITGESTERLRCEGQIT